MPQVPGGPPEVRVRSNPRLRAFPIAPYTICRPSSSGTCTAGSSEALKIYWMNPPSRRRSTDRGPAASLSPRHQVSTR